MMRITIVVIFFGLSFQTFGQFVICDSLIIKGHQTSFDEEGIHNTVDYINKFYPKQRRYISNRNELNTINLWWNSDSTMSFKDETYEVSMTFRNKPINTTHFFYPKSEGESFSRIREYDEGLPFGVTSEDTTVTYMGELIVNGKRIPDRYFSDLLNPNRYETIFSIKPIKVYKSKCNQYLFIYIFGKLNTELMTMNEAADFSYMAKIIVSVNGYYVNRIVVPGQDLKYFGFGECPNFIGF